MATFNLVINYPNGEGPRILSALKSHFNVPTDAEAIEKFRVGTMNALKDIVQKEECDIAVQVARTSVIPITPT